MRTRNRQVLIRLSEKEYLHLKKQAGLAGLKMEPFVRSLLSGVQLQPRLWQAGRDDTRGC